MNNTASGGCPGVKSGHRVLRRTVLVPLGGTARICAAIPAAEANSEEAPYVESQSGIYFVWIFCVS